MKGIVGTATGLVVICGIGAAVLKFGEAICGAFGTLDNLCWGWGARRRLRAHQELVAKQQLEADMAQGMSVRVAKARAQDIALEQPVLDFANPLAETQL